jgi:hypothetical protein
MATIEGQRTRSSFTDSAEGKIDMDQWLSSRDQTVMTATRLHPTGVDDPRWHETLTWDQNAKLRWTCTLRDRRTGQVETASDESYEDAHAAVKQAIGMP